MDRDFRQGCIDIDFPTERFESVTRLLLRSAVLFFSNLPFVAAVTLVAFVPGKLALQFGCYVMDVPTGGILSYLLMDFSDLILSALVVPATICGLVEKMRGNQMPPLGECLRWGRRQWAKTLGYKLVVEITIALSGALLVVPGLVAMVRLIFTDAIVAVEADREQHVLSRSSDLSRGRRWRIFFVLLPMMILDLAGTFLVLGRLEGLTHSRIALALGDSLFSVGGQWTTAVVLLLYLGVTDPLQPAPASRKAGRRPASTL
ncbi:MAG TPA: hypothetical protein VNY05_16950 [Candidatus Acidoferrales bacterium]|jgi:hypothetical protein|nr:hypothetical protein [Candidatus Acidoferrales bacterium]